MLVGGGSVFSWARGSGADQDAARALSSPQQMGFSPASGFRGENPHPSSTSWEQCDGDVPAMAACHDGSSPNP